MFRRSLIVHLVVAASLGARPNVVVLVTDDQQADTIAALGNPHIRTPNLDRLTQEGFTLTRAYCMGSDQGAVCVASRAMFLSGRSLFRVNMQLPSDTPIWPELFRKSGYRTFGVGKWHNGPASFARGFDSGAALFFGGMTNQFRVPIQDFAADGKYPKSREKIGDKFSSELFADEAIRFLNAPADGKPFLLYVAFTSPHDPRTPPGEFARMYDPARMPLPKSLLPQHPFNNGEMTVRDEKLAPWPRTPEVIRRHLADYYGMISHLDAQIGRILAALEEKNLSRNTLLVLFSDHGLAMGRHGLLGKQNLYEHSTRAPLIFRGPGIPAGKQSAAQAYLFDLLPTVAERCGVTIPDCVDGKSLNPILEGRKESHREVIFGAYRDFQRSVNDGRWKLIRYPHIDESQLFDLENDSHEMRNLAGRVEHAATLKRMTELIKREQTAWGDKLPFTAEKLAPRQVELKN